MEILEKTISDLFVQVPGLNSLLENFGMQVLDKNISLGRFIDTFSPDYFEDIGIDKMHLVKNFQDFVEKANEKNNNRLLDIQSITIVGGHDKFGKSENMQIRLVAGSVTSIVGPTGSGKSRLLADIEWIAQEDTPTGRRILVNNQLPDTNFRFSPEYKLVAQLSQNMNFVMDTSVGDFIAMHAESRMVKEIDKVVADIIFQANLLAGESFQLNTPITALSGGQSRALMIADTAFLSSSPIVLIDEIENAGIDRKKALGLLVKKDKIVLIATHDPILALMAPRRLVIKNGGIYKIIETTEAEKVNLEILETMDNKMLTLRNRLRDGEMIESI